MAKTNPFTLTFGKSPNEIISRYEYVNEITGTFNSENPISHAYLIEGIRGSGKTVLMTSIEKELYQEKDWIIVDLNSTQDLLEDFAMRLVDSCKKLTDIFKKGFNFSFAGFGIGLNGENQPRDNVSVISELLENLKKKNKKVLITIDEVMNGENMRHFASEFQILLRKDYPIFLLMTGLYENIYSIQNDPALTFLLRTPKIKVEPLSIAQITKTYQNVFETDIDTADLLYFHWLRFCQIKAYCLVCRHILTITQPRAVVRPSEHMADPFEKASAADFTLNRTVFRNDDSLLIVDAAGAEDEHALILIDQNLNLFRPIQRVQKPLVQENRVFR